MRLWYIIRRQSILTCERTTGVCPAIFVLTRSLVGGCTRPPQAANGGRVHPPYMESRSHEFCYISSWGVSAHRLSGVGAPDATDRFFGALSNFLGSKSADADWLGGRSGDCGLDPPAER